MKYKDIFITKTINSSVDFIIIALLSLLFLLLTRKIAKKIGLVDKPNHRKKHQGQIPLVGGVSIYSALCFAFLYKNYYIPHLSLYLICAGILVFIGLIDDLFEIGISIRAIIQVLIITFIIINSGCYINSLGYILGSKEITLGSFGYVITLFAIWSTINAFNMIDGIDGLLGSITCISLSAISILLAIDNVYKTAISCLIIIAAIIPYILLNLKILGKKYQVFMGDAGSTMSGFTIAWLLLQSIQGQNHPARPVTALWIIAIPLMDMLSIINRRIYKGMNPFTADQQHIHHLMIKAGFNPRRTVTLITVTATLLAFFGIVGEKWLKWPESIMLLIWVIFFLIYNYILVYDKIKFLFKKYILKNIIIITK